MAKQQRALRGTAETENAALRRLAVAQQQSARAIKRLVVRSAASLKRTLPPPTSFADYHGPEEDPYDQLQSLEGLVQQPDDVFQRHDMSSLHDAFFKTSDPTADGVELELQMSWVLPFVVDAVAEAFWRKPTRGSMGGKATQFQELYEDADVSVGQFISTPVQDAVLPLAHGQVAARRLTLPNGSHLSVSTIMAHVFNGNAVQAVVYSQEWMRFERFDDRPGMASSCVSRVQWSRRLRVRPNHYAVMTPTERRRWTLGMVTGPMRGRIERSLQRKIQEAENWLLSASSSS